MEQVHEIVQAVYEAKVNNEAADTLIRQYIPFIQAETAKFLGRPCENSDDAYSIAMIAFHEAILGYDQSRGAFLSYAALLIRNRLIDDRRKQLRHMQSISLDASEELAVQTENPFEQAQIREVTRQEIAELSAVMAQFGICFADVADHTPKQARTRKVCLAAIRYAMKNRQLLEELLHTKKLPMNQLVLGSGADRKTLERHRKYILAMLLIQTNGYEIIRGHLRHMFKEGGSPT